MSGLCRDNERGRHWPLKIKTNAGHGGTPEAEAGGSWDLRLVLLHSEPLYKKERTDNKQKTDTPFMRGSLIISI